MPLQLLIKSDRLIILDDGLSVGFNSDFGTRNTFNFSNEIVVPVFADKKVTLGLGEPLSIVGRMTGGGVQDPYPAAFLVVYIRFKQAFSEKISQNAFTRLN